ncbi:MAG: PorT family protein [Bacteroidia bacterium]|nr:PorT family protein [Bacteroidia bacterium]
MKKLIITFNLLFFAFLANAQNVEIGIKAGISSDKIKLEDVQNVNTKIEGNVTTNIGAYLRASTPIGLYVQPEAVFNRRGSNFTVDGLDPFSHTANYVDVPVLLGWRFLKTVRVFAGPNFQFLMKQVTEIPNDPNFKAEDLKGFNTGYQVGAGLDLLRLRVDLKYDFNVNDMGSAFSYKGVSPTLQNNMITLQLGYRLFSLL